MASEASGSNPADSYVGSLISLTSKYEIRYEGILYNINTEESSIGLRNVRSYGTEGRKKDGPQVPPNDKVYEYILFRGSDIKDLQVKASPPVQTTLPSYNDPAIIQSHYSRPPTMSVSLPAAGSGPVASPSSHTAEMEATRSTFQCGVPLYQPGESFGSWGSLRPPNADGSGLAIQSQYPPPSSAYTSLPSAGSGSVADPSSNTAQMAAPRSTFQGGIPLYQPGGSLGSWGSSPPNADGSGLAMPMYWQGLYGPPNGLSYVQQQSFHHSPPGLSMPHSMHQPIYPGLSAPILTGSPNLPASGVTAPYFPASDLRELAPPLLPPFSIGSTNLTSSTPQSTLLPQSAASEISRSLACNMVSSALSLTATPSPSLPLLSQLTSSGLDTNGIRVPGSMPKTAPILSLPYQTMPPSVSPNVGAFRSSHSETSTLPLVTPGQLLQPVSATLSSSVSLDPAKKDVEVVQAASSKPPPSAPVTTRALKLPLPTPANQKLNGPSFQTHPNRTNRGRERGRENGISRRTKFMEEFDFMAMNEKFKKDEVWGDLGKTEKTNNKEDAGKEDDGVVFENDDDMGSLKVETPVYVKDDFFDSLSCNSLGNGQRNGRPKFSQQMKVDSETFGDFPRRRGGRGGRWPGRGGRSWGSYYGRGYGYVGRAQGYY